MKSGEKREMMNLEKLRQNANCNFFPFSCAPSLPPPGPRGGNLPSATHQRHPPAHRLGRFNFPYLICAAQLNLFIERPISMAKLNANQNWSRDHRPAPPPPPFYYLISFFL